MDIGGIIEQVRCLVQDIDTPYRYGDAVLIGYIGQSVQRIAVVRPDVFATLAEVTCGTSEAPGGVNLYAPDDSIRIIDCHAVVGGNAMKEIDKGALDRSAPDWRIKPPCAPREFARNVNNPNLMFVSPPARATDKVIIEYAQTPPEYNAPEAGEDATDEMLAQKLGLSNAYTPFVINYTMFLVESMQDESVNSGRAQVFLDAFNSGLGIATQSRVITDTPTSGLPSGGVLAR